MGATAVRGRAAGRAGGARAGRRLSSSPRSRVWRVRLPETTAVVKRIVGGSDADQRYDREVAALRLAARAEPPVVPVLLATEPGERVLVLEHLDHRRPAGAWIVDYAAALARLHATARPEDAGVLPRWQGPNHADIESFLRLAGELEVPVAPGVAGELHDLVDRLDRLGRASGDALLHGDPCPGNDLHTATGVRFIDRSIRSAESTVLSVTCRLGPGSGATPESPLPTGGTGAGTGRSAGRSRRSRRVRPARGVGPRRPGRRRRGRR